jgi:radical SAM superfamily enzyme YgiQ (UPF0313 family)
LVFFLASPNYEEAHMKIALVGAELEENLGLRYIASSLEHRGHTVDIVAFNEAATMEAVVAMVLAIAPDITGLSMVFTARAREFCALATALREAGYRGHIIGGGPFASFNCERVLTDFPAFDTIGLGEGERLMCDLAERLDDPSGVAGLCYRDHEGRPVINVSADTSVDLDDLPWPKRTTFDSYFGTPIASMLTSRGCWRNCAFCSINAWYERVGGKKFRVRSTEGIVAEVADLYHNHGVRAFNFQDDNFFLPKPDKAARRFAEFRDGLRDAGVGKIAIMVKARPDSITRETIGILDELGLFRVFLGVENGCDNALRKLNRKNSVEEVCNALRILNDYDVHIAYNLLMFEPHTDLSEILANLRFIERHIDNPFNFCRAEAYPGTGLADQLAAEGLLQGDYFGFDYRLVDPRAEMFHQIANFAFYDRNFNDSGLHYFNMQVDFTFQLLRRLHPETLTERLRAAVKNFIKETNLDTYAHLCAIHDFVAGAAPGNRVAVEAFARQLRESVDAASARLIASGQSILGRLEDSYNRRNEGGRAPLAGLAGTDLLGRLLTPYSGAGDLQRLTGLLGAPALPAELFGLGSAGPPPYSDFKSRLDRLVGAAETA